MKTNGRLRRLSTFDLILMGSFYLLESGQRDNGGILNAF